MRNVIPRGKHIYDRLAKTKGVTTGGNRPCFEGCPGKRIGVRWADGKLTFPCTVDMFTREDGTRQLKGRGS